MNRIVFPVTRIHVGQFYASRTIGSLTNFFFSTLEGEAIKQVTFKEKSKQINLSQKRSQPSPFSKIGPGTFKQSSQLKCNSVSHIWIF